MRKSFRFVSVLVCVLGYGETKRNEMKREGRFVSFLFENEKVVSFRFVLVRNEKVVSFVSEKVVSFRFVSKVSRFDSITN